MATYTPAAPWAGPYPQAVVDNYGNNWEAYGPNQLKKPTTVIAASEDCCMYTTEVTEALPDEGDPPTPAFLPPGKSDGDTYYVCHPNGSAMWECVGGAWTLAWVKCFANNFKVCIDGEFVDVPKGHEIEDYSPSIERLISVGPNFSLAGIPEGVWTMDTPIVSMTIPNTWCHPKCLYIRAGKHAQINNLTPGISIWHQNWVSINGGPNLSLGHSMHGQDISAGGAGLSTVDISHEHTQRFCIQPGQSATLDFWADARWQGTAPGVVPAPQDSISAPNILPLVHCSRT